MMSVSVLLAFLVSLQTIDPGKPPQKSSASPKVVTPPRLSQPQVDAIIKAAVDDGSEYSFLPEIDSGDEGSRLSVNTSRALIAFRAAKAGPNAKIKPSALELIDNVTISCGNEELGSRFDCAKVRVLKGGRPVTPFLYRPSVNSYRNALGAKWQVREVMALYPFDALSLGFVVEYTGQDGTVWTFRVSQETMQRLRVISD